MVSASWQIARNLPGFFSWVTDSGCPSSTQIGFITFGHGCSCPQALCVSSRGSLHPTSKKSASFNLVCVWTTLWHKINTHESYSEIVIFEKLRISYPIPWKSPPFPEILKVRTPSKITKNNSQGIIFVIILGQRVSCWGFSSSVSRLEQSGC